MKILHYLLNHKISVYRSLQEGLMNVTAAGIADY